MTVLAGTVFWLTAAAVATTYVLYPALLALLGLLAGLRRRSPPAPRSDGEAPRVTVLLAAHDEAAVIGARVDNLLALDYPPDRLDILVVSDASRNGTAAVARERADGRVRVIDLHRRAGKTAALMEALEHVTGDILVFTDANSRFRPDAVRRLTAPFADPAVGCVVGRLDYVNTGDPRIGHGEGLYWRYENAIKRWESAVASTIVANGAIYAIRRRLVRPVPPHVDPDSTFPLQALASGSRVVFEPAARAAEKAAETLREELGRKYRIILFQLWGLTAVPGLLRRPGPALMLFCHKILRWCVPFLLLANLVAAVALWPSAWAVAGLAAHLAVAAAAGAGGLLRRLGRPPGRWWVATYFWAVNLVSAAAVLAFLAGRRMDRWEKAASTR